MIAVIAHQENHFKDFLYWVSGDGDREKFHFVSSEEDLRSKVFSEVLRVGPYWHIHNHEGLYRTVLSRIINK